MPRAVTPSEDPRLPTRPSSPSAARPGSNPEPPGKSCPPDVDVKPPTDGRRRRPAIRAHASSGGSFSSRPQGPGRRWRYARWARFTRASSATRSECMRRARRAAGESFQRHRFSAKVMSSSSAARRGGTPPRQASRCRPIRQRGRGPGRRTAADRRAARASRSAENLSAWRCASPRPRAPRVTADRHSWASPTRG